MLRFLVGTSNRYFASSHSVRKPVHHSLRRCASQTENRAQAAAGAKIEGDIAGQSGRLGKVSASQRKDWRTHKEVLYVKGVPVKGSLFKLPLSEQLLICLVFSLAGSAAVFLVRPQIRHLCHQGFLGLPPDASWLHGPWLYRVIYVLIMFPCYSLILFTIGGIFGRRIWFSFMIHKMWSRFLTKRGSERLRCMLDLQHY